MMRFLLVNDLKANILEAQYWSLLTREQAALKRYETKVIQA